MTPTRQWFHSFDAWGAQCIHRVKTVEDAVTQHLLHYGLLGVATIHVDAHVHLEPECPTVFRDLYAILRPQRCSEDHTREVDDEIGTWKDAEGIDQAN